ncbi:hypothetical protein GLW05_15710 [Pontibacillus yanchengensis]|uniref:Uncharacterized protein n=1 Tax=Pontibacillus yanchengensis TaxID=462910 RepID=A0A6I5A487_9BACI|nr:hypothetical protein [Pontibacillus yanchengensis]MYL35029.1 hypothetical protein [Pontibacillus yanchengensis]
MNSHNEQDIIIAKNTMAQQKETISSFLDIAEFIVKQTNQITQTSTSINNNLDVAAEKTTEGTHISRKRCKKYNSFPLYC